MSLRVTWSGSCPASAFLLTPLPLRVAASDSSFCPVQRRRSEAGVTNSGLGDMREKISVLFSLKKRKTEMKRETRKREKARKQKDYLK